MARRQEKSPYAHIAYPPGCKELSEELSKEELLKRLKLLAKAFQEMAQDENNASEYKQLALYLVSEFFLDHRNKDVRLLVACCIADIFRVFAPEAPFTDSEVVKEIFTFLAQQLKGLNDPDSVAFKRYFYLLENLATVKSFNICLEFDDIQEVFVSLYKLFFGIVNEKHSAKVTGHMLDIMTPLIAEADSVSQDLLDVVLGCILEPFKTQNRPAYHLASDLVRSTVDALEPYIQTFFNNTLMLGNTSNSVLSDRVYDLIQELNIIQPTILLSVLPQLEFKLKSGDEAERLAVTRMLGKMFSAVESNLATLHRPLWACYLGRFNDIAANVRRVCVQLSQEFLVNHPDLVKDIAEHLQQRQHDSDEDVRMDVVQAVVGAAKRSLASVPVELLDSVRERTLDKKFKIRKEALVGLGQIYRRCCENDVPDDIKCVSWIRNKVLHAYYHSAVDDKILVERILNTSLVPFSLDAVERMKRLYTLYANLDEHAIKALQEIFRTQLNLRSVMRSLLEPLQRGDKDEAVITTKIVLISRSLPEPVKTQESLKKFVKIVIDDVRIRGQLLKLVSPDCECKRAEEAVKDILKKLGNPVPQNTVYMTVKALLERMAPVLIDGMAVSSLLGLIDAYIKSSQSDDDNIESVADADNPVGAGMKLLLLLSTVYPVSFQQGAVYETLIAFLQYDDDKVVEGVLQIFKNIGHMMEQTHSNIFMRLLPLLMSFVKTGSPKQAKYAIRCIDAMCRSKDVVFKQLFEHLEKNVDVESADLLTSLVAIGHLAQMFPSLFAQSTHTIVSRFVVKELLMQVRTSVKKGTADWCHDDLVSEETLAKVEGLKMIVRWLLGVKSSSASTVNPTLRLLYSMVLSEGDLTESKRISKGEMARLRLQAGCCMLKLAQEPVYADAIKLEQFQTMALLASDECAEVRTMFIQKLHKGLMSLRLPLQYLSIMCLAVNETDKSRRTVVKQMLTANINRRREYLRQNSVANTGRIFALLPDYVLPYAIHLLAHDPDLTGTDDVTTLSNIRECLWFLMEPLIKSENYNFTFYKKMLEKIKQCKDALCPDNEEVNQKLYSVCDLASGLMMSKTANIVLKDSPAEPLLPQKLFTEPDLTVVNSAVYLPKELQNVKSKKPNAAQPSTKKSTHEPKSPDSSVSSSPSSPVSSLKSVPVAHSRQSCVSKLRAARAALEMQTGSKAETLHEETEMATSPGSSDSPRSSNRKTASKKSTLAPKRAPLTSEIKKTSPARTDSSASNRKLMQGKISDYVKPQSKSLSRSRSRRMSEESTSSSKNGPTIKQSERRRARDSSEESSDRRPSPPKKRQSSMSSVSRSSSPPAKKSTAVNRVAAKQGSTTSKSQKPTAKRKAAHESRSTPEAPAKRSRLNASTQSLSSSSSPTSTAKQHKASKLMNGSSSSRQKDVATGSSQQRYKGRLALKRRAGAAAKAAQKYADFEVSTKSPAKKR